MFSLRPTMTATARPTLLFIAHRRASGICTTVRIRALHTKYSALPATFRHPPTSTATAKPTSPSSARRTALGIAKTAPTASLLPSSSAPTATSQRKQHFGIKKAIAHETHEKHERGI